MFRFQFSLLFALCLALSLGWSQTANNPSGGSFRAITGEVQIQKGPSGKWAPARVNGRVREKDRIRTLVESQATVQFGDGSSISIEENSVVDLALLLQDGTISQSKVDVRTGRILFNIQRIAGARSSFEFETATATAAIRGTEGGIGSQGSRTYAYLSTGRMDLQGRNGGKGISLQANEVALQTPQGFRRFRLPPGRSVRAMGQFLDRILQDTTQSPDSELEALEDTTTVGADTSAQDSTPTGAGEIGESPQGQCTLDPTPETVDQARLALKGSCPDGTEIQVGAARTVASGGRWSLDLAWPGNQYGVRKFDVRCHNAHGEFPCGTLAINYVQKKVPLLLQLTTPKSVVVCNGPLVLSGHYAGTDARLTARMGTRTFDLTSATGQFSRSIPISDADRNWDINSVQLVLTGAGEEVTEEIRVEVDRTCRDVNRQPPQLVLQPDAAQCQVLVSVSGVSGDRVTLTISANGMEQESQELSSDIRGRRFPLQAGEQDYVFRAVDLAGNTAERALRRLACWPDARFDIAIEGASREVLRIPPPPPGQRRDILRNLRFRLRNLPADDYRYIQKIVVRHEGRVLREWTGTQIDRTDFEIELSLLRGSANLVRIEVTPKNGRIRYATKEFDLR